MKRLLAMLLSGVLLASSAPIYSYGAVTTDVVVGPATSIAVGEPAPDSNTEPTTAGLETAIKTIKQKISIPKEYTQFNYYFSNSSYYSNNYWSLNWTNPTTNSFIQVNSDADFHITYFYHYDYDKKTAGVSKYLKNELKTTAEEFMYKIAPDTKNKIEFIDSYYEGVYSGNYVYNYQRRNNGISFPDNTVTIWVNSVTGEVTSASVNWLYDEKVPSSKATITKEEAGKLIRENMKMKLVYRSNYFGIYDKGGSGEVKAFLVYEPTASYISVDAKTGEIYNSRNQWVDTTAYETSAKDEASTSALMGGSAEQNLTEDEITKIEELKNIITKEKAIDLITGNSSLYLDKNLKSYTAYLGKMESNDGKTSYVWNINLSDPREVNYETDKDSYRAYAYATVDAQTGKILSFYASMKGYYDEKNNTWTKVKIPYDKEESKVILEKFLKAQVKERFSNSILVGEYEGYVAYYKEEVPVYGGYNYQYNRVSEGIEYPYNYISGSVDGVTGKIYSFNTYWDDSIKFESPKGAITAEKAMDYYLSNDGFGLKYEVNIINKYDSTMTTKDSYYDYSTTYSAENEIRLVYRPDVTPAFISPFTGEQLNYDGGVLKETKPYTYSDIKDTPENRNIFLLADMNVGFEGDKFLPDQNVTIGEINKLLQDIGFGYGYIPEEDNKSKQLLTKEVLAKLIIDKLGLDKVSKLKGIYSTGFADENQISSEYIGAVALAKGLGIFEADSANKFNPDNNITRADAVNLLFKFISVQQSGVLN